MGHSVYVVPKQGFVLHVISRSAMQDYGVTVHMDFCWAIIRLKPLLLRDANHQLRPFWDYGCVERQVIKQHAP